MKDNLSRVYKLMAEVGEVVLHNKNGTCKHANDYPFLEAMSANLGVRLTVSFRLLEAGYGLTFTLATGADADLQEVKRRANQLRELNCDIKHLKIYFKSTQTNDIVAALSE